MLERLEAAGRSPTRELLWSWAQQNTRVQDLCTVLQEMGHQRALQLFQGPAQVLTSGNQSHDITFQDIKEGTRDFHHELRIADGHFSDVYRAQIRNQTFAVKLFKQDGANPLSWQERLTIIKGVAKALHHLHTAQPCPVICGNISSANILLDDALQPKLSNFGLARLRPNSANQNCTITLDTSLHSNLGYLPEEYIRDSKLSFSLDVFSFGMRDLLVTEVENSGGVDSCLQFLDKAAGQWPTALALSLLTLALDCTASRHRHRPNMENVLGTLSQLLPPPTCPPADQPHSLDDSAAVNGPENISPSIPVEHDEQLSLPGSPAQEGPCECSQSEVTYLSVSEASVDLYGSWPVQCSCADEAGGLACEDCRANGFTLDPTQSPQTDFSGVSSVAVENPVKERLRNKLSLYNRGLIHSAELFSEPAL
ncbi:hypothetical protein INR49_000207 [Caranx melampygus]|nr:hypothetical protein INR49_000207 [Caranx melampygus]